MAATASIAVVSVRMTIGQFAKLTHLSVKTLRHYHETNVLAPAWVDDATGYRYYEHSQAHRAHLVRRLRAADMSLPEIAELLGDVDGSDRRSKVAAHADALAEWARELAEAAEALRSSLAAEVGALDIVRREFVAEPAVTIVGQTDLDHVERFCADAFERLDRAIAGEVEHGERGSPERRVSVVGPGVASFDDDVFTSTGVVRCALPVALDAVEQLDVDGAGMTVGETPGGVFLVATHAGDRSEVGITYSALGRHVDELGVAAPRPVVERYVVATGAVDELRTEVCWPVIS